MKFRKDRYLSVFGNLPNPAFLFDRDGRLENMNRAAALLLGESFEPGRTGRGNAPRGEPPPVLAEDLARFLEADIPSRGFEKAIETPAGLCHYQVEMRRTNDASGKIDGTVVILNDITRRKEAEETLQVLLDEMEARVEERAGEEERTQRHLNRALRMMWGCGRALLDAKDETELLSEVCRIAVEVGGYRLVWAGFAEDDPGKTVRPVAQSGFEDGYLQNLSITWADAPRGRGPTGTAIRSCAPVVAHNLQSDPQYAPWREEALSRGFRSSAAFPLGRDGRPLGSLNIYASEPDAFSGREVELLSELADTLAYGIRSLRAETARRREEDRREVAEVRLRRAQRMESVAKLAGGVAHNLNNLLTVINGYGFLLEKELPDADPRKRMAEEVLRSGQRAAELTNQLLAYSRQQMLSPRELEVGGLLREMEPGLREICGPGIALSVAAGRSVLRVDPEGFRQMLFRLLTHSCEEMERVGEVEIRAFDANLLPGEAPPEVGLTAGEYLVLSVRDTGPTMDKESRSHVFDPFLRPLESGAGLELSSVYGFVKQSGGYIWVDGEPGAGNRFIACFPKPGKSE